MTKKLNTTEKKLKFHCSVCFTAYQLLEAQSNLRTKSDTKCLNHCQAKWQSLLITYCQEQLILDFTKKEQEKDKFLSETKDKKEQDLADWLEQIRKQNHK